jgi:hypothetical protein
MAARGGNPARGRVLCIEALRLSDAIGDRAGSTQALNFLSAISRDEGERGKAMARYAEGLRLARGVGDLWATCWALDGLAAAARELDELEIAARILARSAGLAARSWYVPSPRELRDLDVMLLRKDLGAEDFARASAGGGVMSAREVVACALAFATRNARPVLRVVQWPFSAPWWAGAREADRDRTSQRAFGRHRQSATAARAARRRARHHPPQGR